MHAKELNPLQRRIIAALQVDCRAPWRKIAEVLGEPERTVARYGTEMLEKEIVIVAAVDHTEHQVIVACKSAPGTARLSGEALTRRSDVNYCYLTTGTSDVVVEIGYRDDLSELLTLQLPATAGLLSLTALPVLKYFKTIRGWRCGALTETEENALLRRTGADVTAWSVAERRGPHDTEIISALRDDGRIAIETLARRVRMSTTTVSRRLDWMLDSGQFSIRALVAPALVGFEVEALLWVQVSPGRVESLGQELRRWQAVRYAAAIAGTYQMLVDITVTSHANLYALLSHAVWAEHAILVHTDLVVEVRKRGGRMFRRESAPID